MSLTLSSAEHRQLAAAIVAMLSPLAHDTREAWFGDISLGIRPLFAGDSTLFTYSAGNSSETYSVDAPALAAGFAAATDFVRGQVHFKEPEMENVMIHARRKRAIGVFTSEMLDHLTDGQLRRSLFYNEVARPLGALIDYGMGLTGSDGEALLGVNVRRVRRDPLGEDTLALLGLLAPAFQCGFEIRARMSQSQRSLMLTIDMLTEPVFVFETVSGKEIHRNPALTYLLNCDPEALLVQERGLQVARALSSAHHAAREVNAHASTSSLAPTAGDLHTSTARYILRASTLPLGTFSEEHVVLVCVERLGISLPLPASVRNRHGLTARETDVALRLAVGETDQQVAQALGVSRHTVRHHTERIFAKLDLHSRKALALRLAEPC